MAKTRFFLAFFVFWVGHHIFLSFRSQSKEEETSGNLSVKSKLSPRCGSVAL